MNKLYKKLMIALTVVLLISNSLDLKSQNTLIPFSGSNAMSSNGTLCTHAGCGNTYSDNANGYTVINVTSGNRAQISGTYNTESCCDYVRVYAGAGTGGTVLGTYFGSGTFCITSDFSQSLTVQFYTDGSVVNSGLQATVTYNPSAPTNPTAITPSATTICNGASTTLTASGIVGTVYWYTGSCGGTQIGTGNSINVSPSSTTTYYARNYNNCVFSTGCASATVTVNPVPTVNAISNQVACAGGSVSAISFSGAVAGTVYNWTNNNTAVGLAASGTGDISAFTTTNTGTSPITATVTVTPTYTNAGTTCTGTSRTFTITVNPAPTVNSISNQTVCQGSTVSAVSFSGAVAGTTYSWTNDNTSIGLGASGNGTIGSFTAVNGGTSALTATITVTPGYTNAGVTCTGTAQTFTITVNPVTQVDDPEDQTICNNGTAAATNFTSSVAGTTFTWTNSNTAIGLAASGTGNIASFTTTNTGTVPVSGTITVTPSYTNGGATCTGAAQTFTIKVLPTPDVDQPADQVICNNGTTSSVSFSGTVGGTVFNWVNDNTSIGLAASGTGNIGSFTAVNTTSAPITGTITVTPGYTEPFTATFIECVAYTGDDRGGIVATQNYVYLRGDNYVGRFNHDLTGAVAIGVARDCLFSDFSGTGKVYTFANSGSIVNNAGIVNQIWELDANLATIGVPVNLSSSLNLGNNSTIFSGSGYMIVNNATDDHFYRISLPSGTVTDMGASILSGFQNYTFWTENWARWGFSEYSGGEYSVIYRNQSSQNIERYNINTGARTVLYSFTNLSDMANIVLSPWDSRVYVHWEGGTQWGGSDESVGYLPYPFVASSTTCTGTPKSFTITVNPTPTVDAVSNQVFCNGTATNAINFSGTVTGTVYNWTNNNTAIGLGASGTGSISSFTATNAGTSPISATITVTPTFTNGGVTCTGTARTFTITINPTVQVNDPADQVVCTNSATTAVNFGTVYTGGTTTYAWTNDNTSIGLAASGNGNIASFTAINNGTAPATATITITPSFTNGGVTCSGTAQTFTITVNPGAQVNDPSDTVICHNTLVPSKIFSTNNTGGTTTYTWTNNNTSIGLAASGTGNVPAFTATNTGTAPVTATITVSPGYTNAGVTCTGTAQTYTITVNPSGQVNQPADIVICNNGSTSAINFSTSNTGGTTAYAWSNNNTSIGLAANGNGNIASFTAINTGTTPIVATITVNGTFNNQSVACGGSVKTFTITVNPSAQVSDPTDVVYCNGATTAAVNFNTVNTVGTTTYSWTNDNTSIGLGASGNGPIGSFTTVNGGTTPLTATITVTPAYTNAGVTCTGTPQSFTITVNPVPQVDNPEDQTVCNNGTAAATIFTSSVSGTTFAWTNSNTAIGLAASGTGSIGSFTATNTGTSPISATITVTPSFTNGGVTCTGTAKTFTITVNPTAQANDPADQVVCANSATSAVNFGTVYTGGTITYAWTNDNTSIGLAASGNGNIASFTAVNNGTAPATATITVTPYFTNGGVTCTGTIQTFTITVNPIAQANDPGNQVVCNNGTTNLINFGTVFTGGTTTYAWTNNNTSIGLAASGNGNIASFTAINTGSAPVTATITVTPSFTNGGVTCTGTIRIFTITVNPTVALNQPANQTVCNGTATAQEVFTTIYTGGTTTYTWANNLPGIGLPASGTGNVPSFTAINNQLVPVTATITVTPTFTNGGISCTGLPSVFTITVNPTPTITCPANILVTNDPGVCGAIVNYPPATATGTPTPVITYSIASGTLFPVGTTTVTATATNECGIVSCDFTITVVDNEQPVISCPSNITVTAVGACTQIVTYSIPTATDNCPGVTVTRTAGLASGAAFPLGVTTVTHKATDAYGNTSSCSFTVTVTDGQVPAITSQPANTTVCNGATASFAVTATHAVGYQWQSWNGNSWNNIAGATSANYSFSNASVSMNTNSYRVNVIGLCNNTVSAHASVYVNPNPVIQLSASGSTELLPTQQLAITATVNRSGGTYVWYKNNVIISGASSAVLANLTVDDAGTYKVVYTDMYGCSTTSDELVISAKGSDYLYIYPNPNDGRFSVRFYNQSMEVATVRVFDNKGAIVYQRKQAVARPYASIVIDLPAAGIHPGGAYLVQVVNNNGVVVGIRSIIVYH